MDNIYLLGAIASIIMFCLPLGKILLRVIKNSKISFFNLAMLFIVLLYTVSAGYYFWRGEGIKGAIWTAFLMFWILSWLVQYLFQKQQEILRDHLEIIKDTHNTMTSMNQEASESIDRTGKILLDMNQAMQDIIKWIGHILVLMRKIITQMVQADENLNNEIKTLQDEIRKVDITPEPEELGDWQKYFADRFVRYLEACGSPLSEFFMGKDRAWLYPEYIGFNIGTIENLSIHNQNDFWLLVRTDPSKEIINLKLRINDPQCFNDLKQQQERIEREFGDKLEWEFPEPRRQYTRIGVDLKVNPLDENRDQWNAHFKEMRETLEKLNEIFLSRIKLYFEDIPF